MNNQQQQKKYSRLKFIVRHVARFDFRFHQRTNSVRSSIARLACHHSDARFVFVFTSFYLFTRAQCTCLSSAWNEAGKRAKQRRTLFECHIVTSHHRLLCSSRTFSDYLFRIFGLFVLLKLSLQRTMDAEHSIFDLYSLFRAWCILLLSSFIVHNLYDVLCGFWSIEFITMRCRCISISTSSQSVFRWSKLFIFNFWIDDQCFRLTTFTCRKCA